MSSYDLTPNYYKERLRRFGDTAESFWANKSSQEARFEALLEIGNIHGKTVLDVGCGTGHLLEFLKKKRVRIAGYLGCDIVLEAVQMAREKYPDYQFKATDILKLRPGMEAFDYVLGSGLFALKEDSWTSRMLEIIQTMFQACRIGVGVNFLSRYSKVQDTISQYSDPGKILSLLMKEVTINIVLRHDYKENDFTVYLYKW